MIDEQGPGPSIFRPGGSTLNISEPDPGSTGIAHLAAMASREPSARRHQAPLPDQGTPARGRVPIHARQDELPTIAEPVEMHAAQVSATRPSGRAWQGHIGRNTAGLRHAVPRRLAHPATRSGRQREIDRVGMVVARQYGIDALQVSEPSGDGQGRNRHAPPIDLLDRALPRAHGKAPSIVADAPHRLTRGRRRWPRMSAKSSAVSPVAELPVTARTSDPLSRLLRVLPDHREERRRLGLLGRPSLHSAARTALSAAHDAALVEARHRIARDRHGVGRSVDTQI